MVWFGGTDKDVLVGDCFIPGGTGPGPEGDSRRADRAGQKGWAREGMIAWWSHSEQGFTMGLIDSEWRRGLMVTQMWG